MIDIVAALEENVDLLEAERAKAIMENDHETVLKFSVEISRILELLFNIYSVEAQNARR